MFSEVIEEANEMKRPSMTKSFQYVGYDSFDRLILVKYFRYFSAKMEQHVERCSHLTSLMAIAFITHEQSALSLISQTREFLVHLVCGIDILTHLKFEISFL